MGKARKEVYKASDVKTADGYGNIRVAILEQAIDDYRGALINGDQYKITTLENWFLSEWGECLSGGNGAYIIEKVKQQLGKDSNGNVRKQNKRRKLLSN